MRPYCSAADVTSCGFGCAAYEMLKRTRFNPTLFWVGGSGFGEYGSSEVCKQLFSSEVPGVLLSAPEDPPPYLLWAGPADPAPLAVGSRGLRHRSCRICF